tara:strand:+ start:331 stop:666 length:336 start_codon:yes stop_codon:yes gene_type:complete
METKNRTVGKLLTTANADIYTVPNNFEAGIDNIHICNESGTAATISLDWYEAQTTTFFTLTEALSIPANSVLLLESRLWLFKGDKLRGLASANSSITVTFRVDESYLPQRN